MNTKALKEEPGITSRHFDGSVELLKTVRGFVDQDQPPARLETYGAGLGWTQMAETIRVPTGDGDDPFALNRLMDVRRLFTGGERWGRYYEVQNLESPVLDLLNVRFIITRDLLPSIPKYKLVATPPYFLLYERISALPRFFLVNRTIGVSSEQQAIALMGSRDHDPATTAIVEGASSREYPDSTRSPVTVLNYGQNDVVLETNAVTERFLVTSEADYPGWHATLDGRETPIIRTNAAFRGLEIPGGRHRIVFRFRPPILWWSAGVSAAALVVLGFALRRNTKTSLFA
jgi:hypothetical protein